MIKLVKLLTETDIIADVEEQQESDDIYYLLKNPVQLIANERGQPALIPYSPLTEGDVRIKRSNTLYVCKVREEIQNAYSMNFGGVVTARPDEVNRMKQKLFI